MRILFSLLDAGLGGGQQGAAWLAEAAVARGHAVGLLVPEPGPTQARFAALRSKTHLARLQRLRDPRDVPDAARVLRDYDVLWSHTAIGGQLLGDVAARWARRPHVIHQHTYPQFASREPEATMQRLLARTFLGRRRFIAVAPHVRDGLVAIGIRPGRIEVVPNGVPLPPIVPPRDVPPIRVGLLGRFDPGKGMLEFIEAVRTAGLTSEQATFTIGGSSGPFASYEAEARDRAADAGIAIEEPGTDGTGFLALLEAMALGKAVVASDIPGVTSITGSDGPAVLVPLANADALADAIRHLAADPSRQVALGRAARELVADRFKLETMTDRALDFLEHSVQAAAI